MTGRPLPLSGGYATAMNARSVEFTAPGDVRVVDVEVPDPRDGEVLVTTLYSGISAGTELLAFRGHIDPNLPLDERIGALGGTFSYPFRYGYACVGVVEEGTTELPSGTQVFAFHPHQDRLVVSANDLIPQTDVDPRIATMFPLVETAFQIALDAGAMTDQVVVVSGLGSVGMLSSLMLQRAGARVIGIDPSEARRGIAGDLDISAVAPSDAPECIADATGGTGTSLVVEASGDPQALDAALKWLAHEGTALVASWYGTKLVTLSLGAEFHRRRLSVRSTQVSTIPAHLSSRWTVERRRGRVAELMTELPLKRLATHELPFERVHDAFALLDEGDEAVMHVALSYEGN